MLRNFKSILRRVKMSRQYRKSTAPAAERNKEPILQVLRDIIQGSGDFQSLNILEISSGTGQHISHFASTLPESIFWQPSEYEKHDFESICAHILDRSLKNVARPVFIDVRLDHEEWNKHTSDSKSDSIGEQLPKPMHFKPAFLDYMYNANLMHISHFDCAKGLFRNAGVLLKNKGLLITYGPYARDGVIKPASNVNFDAGLRQQNSHWGLRDIERELIPLAQENKLHLIKIIDMPANNNILLWEKC